MRKLPKHVALAAALLYAARLRGLEPSAGDRASLRWHREAP